MATFINSTASGNTLGGFYTNNPTSTFIDCIATNNGGFGFKDDSGTNVKELLLASIADLKHQAQSSNIPTTELEEIRRELDTIKGQVESQNPQQGVIARSFERLKELTREYTGEIVAVTIFELAKHWREILAALQA